MTFELTAHQVRIPLRRPIRHASHRRTETDNVVVRWFGRHALLLLSQSYPQLFVPHTSTRPFLLTLNDIIHPEVRKLYPGADVPEFDYDTSDPQTLRMGYRSRRKLCALDGFRVL